MISPFQQQHQLEKLINQIPIGILIIDLQGKIEDANMAACQILGRDSEALHHFMITEIFQSEEVTEIEKVLGQLASSQLQSMQLTKPYQRPVGEPIWVELLMSRFDQDRDSDKKLMVKIEDITNQRLLSEQGEKAREELEQARSVAISLMRDTEREKKRAEENLLRLEASEAKIRAIVDNMVDAVITIDQQGIVQSYSHTAERIFGYSPEEMLEQNIKKLMPMHISAKHDGYLKSYAEGGEPKIIGHRREVIARRKDGTEFPADLAVAEIRVQDQHFYTGVVRDISLRKQMEEELVAAEKKAQAANQAKSTFLANMSHELRTPLNAVLGFSEILAQDQDVGQQQRETLNVINRSGHHLLNLINDVLDMSKIEAGHVELKPEPTDLHLLLQDINDMFCLRTKAKALQFSLVLAPTLPRHLLLDAGKVRQILINLLGNSVKFTEQGEIILRCDGKETAEGQWHLSFEVEDSGAGIAEENIETVFDPFAQVGETPAKHKGTGLGLAITRQFIQLMGGEITLKSIIDMGSIFYFGIAAESVDANEVEQTVSGNGQQVVGMVSKNPEWRILIVEDEEDNRSLLHRLLTSVGFHVQEAVNGEEAIQCFKEWQPHFIWMDLHMPVMDGLTASREIRQLPNGGKVKIAAITASVFTEQRSEVLAAGMNDFIRKPYRPHEIFECLEKYLDIRFEYAEDMTSQAEIGVQLDAEMLADLPSDLRLELRDASASLNPESVAAVISRIRETAPTLADGLMVLANDFNFERITALLKEETVVPVNLSGLS